MLIKAIATFKVDDVGDDGAEVVKGEFAELPFSVASKAIQQGCAVKATLDEARAEAAVKTDIPAASEAIKPSKKLKSNDAEPAKE